MDTLKVKVFLQIAQHKSFSKVARDLSYTPSALSHMADALEKELKLQLFERTYRGVELTEAGRKLYDKFAAMFEAENALLCSAAELAQERRDSLRIGTFSSVGLHILPEILHSFKKAYPTVKTSLLVEDDIWDRLHEDVLDIIFVDAFKQDDTTEWYPIMGDNFMAVVPEQAFPGRTSVQREELYDYPLISMEEDNLRGFFACEKFKEVIPISSIENETALSMVKGNIGVAVLPSLSLKNCPKGVKTLSLQPTPVRTIGVRYKTGHLSEVTENFINHLKNCVEKW